MSGGLFGAETINGLRTQWAKITQVPTQRRAAGKPMNVRFEHNRLQKSELRVHYQDIVTTSLLSVLRHWLMIAKIVGGALVLAALLITVLPRKYTAEALVQPELFARGDATKTTTALASIDGASLIASEAQMIQSPAIARAVVKRLGLQWRPEFAPPGSLLGRAAAALSAAIFPESSVSSPLERATRSTRSKLEVSRDTRSYVISIGFTAASPEIAANVANAFALEYLNAKSMQQLSEGVATASRELAKKAAIYGENHPSYMRAVADLELARQRYDTAVNRASNEDLAAGEGVTFAEPSSAPSSPNGSMILGVTFIFALAAGVGLALWLDYRRVGASR